MDNTEVQFTQLLQERGISLTAEQLAQFDLYYKELVSWNEKMNLTGITEREQVYTKHFYDSISLAFSLILTRSPISQISVQELVFQEFHLKYVFLI